MTLSSRERRYNYLNHTPLHSIDEETSDEEFTSADSQDSRLSNASSISNMSNESHQIMSTCEKLILKLLSDGKKLNTRLKKLEFTAGLVESQLPAALKCSSSVPQTITEIPEIEQNSPNALSGARTLQHG